MDIDSIRETSCRHRGRVRAGLQQGADLTNDFPAAIEGGDDRLRAISLVCKVIGAAGNPAVKLLPPPAATAARRVIKAEGRRPQAR
ncbi:MAG: hypothetical protein U1E30_03125 [Rhodoblastus sp.]